MLLTLAVFLASTLTIRASGLVFTCDANVSAVDSNLCTTLNTTTAGQYATVFTNANALIYIQFGSTGGVAQNEQFYNTVTYAQYYNALSSHKSGAADSTAVASLPSSANPVKNGYGVAVTSALDQALGLSGAIGINASRSSCTIGTLGCYNDIITVNNSLSLYYETGPYISGQYDFFTAVEHETNEALGTSSCIGNTTGTPAVSVGCGNFSPGVSSADLFRYSASATRSFLGTDGDQAEGSLAYFSIDGGVTNVAPYNNSNNGVDYGDLSTSCVYVQDAVGCNTTSGTSILNDGGVELAMLDAVGYNLTTPGSRISATGIGSPEPGSIWMLANALALFPLLAIRRRASRRN